MRARFIGDPRNGGEGPALLPFMGVDFVKGDWVDDLPAAAAAKVAGNSHFETEAARYDVHLDAYVAELASNPEDGGGASQTDAEVESLRADLAALQVTFDKRWGVKKLRAALDAATAPDEA